MAGRTVLPGDNQARTAQNPQVLGDGWTAHTKVASNLPYGLAAVAQQSQDLPARWISDRPENSIALLGLKGNHMVTN